MNYNGVVVEVADGQEGLMDERGERVEVALHDDQAAQPAPVAGSGNGGRAPDVFGEQASRTEGALPTARTGEPTTTGEAESADNPMGTLMADMEAQYRAPRRGEVVVGTVVRVDNDGIMVDIGTKSEGVIPGHEAQGIISHAETRPSVGDEVLVYVVQSENQEGHVVLSLRKARSERGWHTAQRQFDEGKSIEAEVVDHNRGGLIVDVDGVRGFVPMSQIVGLRHEGEGDAEGRLAEMVGRQIPLKVLEINRKRNRLILSERAARQELRSQRKEELLGELEEGQVRHGQVSSLCDFGAFVDLGGADGLVHLSELSWSQVAHPRDVVKVGDEVDVYVLGVDRERKKIALSLRRGQAEPWSKVADKYHVGDVVSGKVTKLMQFGAFVRIEDGIEGLIHISELSEGRVQHPKSVVNEGDVIRVRVIRIEADRRRLGLSLRQVGPEDDGGTLVPETDSDQQAGDGEPTGVSVEPQLADR